MTVKQLIDMACAYSGMSKADLARNAGWSPQTLSNRINTGKFSMEDWEKIGNALGASVKIVIEFPDGKRIE
ncbi:MAG TPA: helix-turn-helix domain-containing protein [Subdoligranulum variabile]|uniref:Helix-turn-helix domain-containing protein n=1 Tax=Subdoligranulum variabile TaxID=214851 RepID=A0A921IIQ9_9FIRM|nr:helix-turn-helix domain-containing protein [Subdoligranulum variabile]